MQFGGGVDQSNDGPESIDLAVVMFNCVSYIFVRNATNAFFIMMPTNKTALLYSLRDDATNF